MLGGTRKRSGEFHLERLGSSEEESMGELRLEGVGFGEENLG